MGLDLRYCLSRSTSLRALGMSMLGEVGTLFARLGMMLLEHSAGMNALDNDALSPLPRDMAERCGRDTRVTVDSRSTRIRRSERRAECCSLAL